MLEFFILAALILVILKVIEEILEFFSGKKSRLYRGNLTSQDLRAISYLMKKRKGMFTMEILEDRLLITERKSAYTSTYYVFKGLPGRGQGI